MTPDLVFAVCAGAFGLAIGSFLNVVIYRLPKMMEAEWQAQCAELAGREPGPAPRFNLMVPGSHCPACKTPLRVRDNVPLISYIASGGRCAHCGAAISVRYPVVEAITAVLSAWVAWRFGLGLAGLAALAFTFVLIALTFIDADTTLLPDSLTMPLLWAGLLLNIGGTFVPLSEAVIAVLDVASNQPTTPADGWPSVWTVAARDGRKASIISRNMSAPCRGSCPCYRH